MFRLSIVLPLLEMCNFAGGSMKSGIKNEVAVAKFKNRKFEISPSLLTDDGGKSCLCTSISFGNLLVCENHSRSLFCFVLILACMSKISKSGTRQAICLGYDKHCAIFVASIADGDFR